MENMDKNLIYTFSEGHLNNPLFIHMAGFEKCTPAYYIKRQNSPISILCYVIGGEGILHFGNNRYDVVKDDIFIIPKGFNHEYYVNQKNPWSVLWFNIEGDLFPPMTKYYGLHKQIVFHNTDKTILDLFQTNLMAGNTLKDNNDRQYTYNLVIVEILMKLSLSISSSPYTTKCFLIKQYLDQLLNSSEINSFSLDKMSAELLLSKRQISRIFKEELNVTPYHYFMDEKANLSKQFLLNTTMSIKEISSHLGFYDPYYFSKFFKSKFKLSPQKFREQKQRI